MGILARVREMAKVTPLQLTSLALLVIVGAAILVLPTTISRHLAQSAWMVAVLFVVGVLPVAWVAASLLRRFPGRSFVGMARTALGRLPGSILGLAFSLWWVLVLAVTGRVLAEFVTIALLDRTPQAVLLGVFGLSVAVVLWRGPVPLARLAEVATPLIFAIMFIWFGAGLREGDVRYLLPIGAEGLPRILRATLTPVAFGSSIAAVLLMGRYIQTTRRVGPALYLAVVLVGTIGVMAESLSTLVLGFLRPTQTFPYFKTARLVGLAGFLERVDSAFALGILLGIFITCGVLLFAVADGVAESLSVRRAYRPALGLGVVAFVVLTQVLFPTFAGLVAVLDSWLVLLVALAVQAGLPLVVLAVARLRGKDGRAGVPRTGPRPRRRY
ncbi:MAG TPA: hypothetical protein DHW14_08420, partial [Clostridiales bacterium]|nr:hypothetical protein [Clostridiales bacterium]